MMTRNRFTGLYYRLRIISRRVNCSRHRLAGPAAFQNNPPGRTRLCTKTALPKPLANIDGLITRPERTRAWWLASLCRCGLPYTGDLASQSPSQSAWTVVAAWDAVAHLNRRQLRWKARCWGGAWRSFVEERQLRRSRVRHQASRSAAV